MFDFSIEEGKSLVKIARKSVKEYLKKGNVFKIPANVPAIFNEKFGVFVTLDRIENGKKILRGCIGFPYPSFPLINAVIDAAISAATQDPRFPSVRIEELDQIVFEISVLTIPEQIKVNNPKDFLSIIKIGKDGLIIENNYNKGLLLPQVPVEFNWDIEEYLCQVSIKAGLSSDAWLLNDTKLYRFQAIIFQERVPNGIVEIKKSKKE